MFQFMSTAVLVGGGLIGLMIVVLSMPNSRMREFLKPIVATLFAVGCGVYVISPLDVVPDVIPVAGWIDDLAVAAMGIAAFKNRNS